MAKQILCIILASFLFKFIFAYPDTTLPKPAQVPTYRASAEKAFDLVHTKLDVKFDYQKCRLYGKAWLTLRPHFYQQDSLVLDAKGMFLHKIALENADGQPLAFTYHDSAHIHIALGRSYTASDTITVYINYTARPNEIITQGSAAITKAKGLYFINPTGADKTKPTEIWTQGETEANSCWFPTIDKPNQKTTSEIWMTVPAKYVTLSNGLLVNQTDNKDGTRTDQWKMEQPHAPYLFFMGVGNYTVVKDHYKNTPVEYYMEPKFVPSAQKIYGNTPEMLALYSRLLGVEYPWPKYAQITGNDYISGAMENTSATLHNSRINKTNRELLDENIWEKVIAHEIMHQWFGDLVTAESWSNITVNESFARYGEYLWEEHKYGLDAAGFLLYTNADGYLKNKKADSLHLVRFYYPDKETIFDVVSYNKGATILHMLRNVLGDSAFFAGMQLYLVQNKYQSTEATQVRLAMEQVSGKDLNWFFNEWYYSYGHPKVTINYQYDTTQHTATVILQQTQKHGLYTMPFYIDVYENNQPTRHPVAMQNEVDSFTFHYHTKPQLINVDGDRMMLWEKTDLRKTAADYAAQYKLCHTYADRREALDSLAAHNNTSVVESTMAAALADPYFGLRKQAIRFFHSLGTSLSANIEKAVLQIAQSDPNLPTRAAAIDLLAFNPTAYEEIFTKAVNDSSYSVAGAALEAMANLNEAKAMAIAKTIKGETKGRLTKSMDFLAAIKKKGEIPDSVIATYTNWDINTKNAKAPALLHYANRLKNMAQFKKLVGPIIDSFTTSTKKTEDTHAAIANSIQWLIRQKQALASKKSRYKEAREQLEFIWGKLGMTIAVSN